MDELAAVAPHEIAWQKALWDEDYADYAKVYEAAREVLGSLFAAQRERFAQRLN
jgi:hypothetical protein